MTNFYEKSLKWIESGKYWWVWHVLFWIFIYLDEVLSLVGITSAYDFYLETLFELLVDMLTIYFNLYYLFPKFFLKNKIPAYFALTFLTLLINALFSVYPYVGYIDSGMEYRTMIIGSIVVTSPIIAMAFAIKLFKSYIANQKRVNDLETTGLKTELTFLKNQMNPHFLFNSLNNIYVQSRKRPDEVPNSILQLSDLLRYQLYDCSNDKVALKNEIKYLNDFLQLDALRKSNAMINFDVSGNPNGQQVAPFLFIPFVENAVKHGMSLENESTIDISFKIEREKIDFRVKNSKPKTPIPTKEGSGGIGLVNVQRRLELLYPDKHELKINETKQDYEILLSLIINDN